jgi:hypothetical protein
VVCAAPVASDARTKSTKKMICAATFVKKSLYHLRIFTRSALSCFRSRASNSIGDRCAVARCSRSAHVLCIILRVQQCRHLRHLLHCPSAYAESHLVLHPRQAFLFFIPVSFVENYNPLARISYALMSARIHSNVSSLCSGSNQVE